MALDRFVPRSSVDRGGGNGNERLKPVIGRSFESTYELKTELVPWMRQERVEKASVYAYVGNTDRAVGHFIASTEQGRMTIRDREGNAVALFGMPRTTVRHGRSHMHAHNRVVPINRWLAEKGITSGATFDVFVFEEGDEEQTEQEAEIEAKAKEEGKSIAAVVEAETTAIPEPTPDLAHTPERIAPEEQRKAPKIKGRRLPTRKKPIKAERKARIAEKISSGFESHLTILKAKVHEVVSTSSETERTMMRALHDLVTFMNANPHLKGAFQKRLREEEFVEVRAFLSLYRDDRNLKASYAEHPQTRYLRKLANELFKEEDHSDPYRSSDAMHWSYNTSREFTEYASTLFPDKRGIHFLEYVHAKKSPERWLDIGSGETYRIPTSMMNIIKSINPRITIVGLDPLYDEATAALTDKAIGRHKLDPVWKSRNELVPGTAQNMTFPDASFDEILSLYALDKVNDNVDGTFQSLRQIARVLKPGGEARLFGMFPKGLSDASPLHVYFDIDEDHTYLWDEQVENGRELSAVLATRKKVPADLETALRRDINEWLDRYTRNYPAGK